MDATTARNKILIFRHSIDTFTRHYDALYVAVPSVPSYLHRAYYAALACQSHLNHALTVLDDLELAAKLSDPPTSHAAPGRPTSPGLEPSPPTPA